MTNRISRLAPSPTGALHLGNARTFLINWAMARRAGWILRMRIEDLDGPRVRPESAAETLEVLAWLGIDHDGPVLVQSADPEPYLLAIERLARRGLVYSCDLSRRDILQAASAPHADEHELRYPETLRPSNAQRYAFDRRDTNYRFIVEPRTVVVDDAFAGRVELRPADEVGDFVVWTRRAAPSYQLAVVVDDLRQGVTEVVRGDDLLPSAARQQLLYEAFDAAPPRWCHVPLVRGPDGRRLAKRHGDTRLITYRSQGVPPERIVGLMAWWCGLLDRREPMRAAAFRDAFELDRVPRDPVTFSDEDHQWLVGG